LPHWFYRLLPAGLIDGAFLIKKMEIQEAKKLKKELESKIKDLICNFEDKTGLCVNGVDYDVNRADLGADTGKVIVSSHVNVKIEL